MPRKIFDSKAVQKGTIKLSASDAVDPSDKSASKIRITMFFDADVIRAFKAKASLSGGKYQSLINQTLRDAVLGNAEKKNDRRVRPSKSIKKPLKRKKRS